MVSRSNNLYRRRRRRWSVVVLLLAVLGVGAVFAASRGADAGATVPPPSTYVALGSSYAAGPGITPITDRRCLRSGSDYPHQIAKARHLRLVDVTCSGATTTDILTRGQRQPWSAGAAKPQINAVTPDARLVTVTIGGNDLDYIAQMTTESCGNVLTRALPPPGRNVVDAGTKKACPAKLGKRHAVVGQAQFDHTRDSIIRVVQAIRERAPHARIVLVNYLPVLDQKATTCATVPLHREQAIAALRIFNGLLAATTAAAAETDVDLVSAAGTHTQCSPDPWVTGFEFGNPFNGGPIPYHPNLAGATALARAVDDQLGS